MPAFTAAVNLLPSMFGPVAAFVICQTLTVPIPVELTGQ